jgi:hypothetical protein
MKLGTAMISFLPRALIALPLFVVIVCTAMCAGLLMMLGSMHTSRAPSEDVMTSSFSEG